MSYSLTFYTGSHDGLRAELLNPSEDFQNRLRSAWQQVYEPDEGESPEDALAEGLGEIAKAVSVGGGRLSAKGEFALAAAIESHGQELGSLVHSSSGGEEFREEFLNGLAAASFDQPRLGTYLTHRPLFGLNANGYPDWGYLLRDELAQLVGYYKKPTVEPEKEMGSWLAELVELLKRAKDADEDLITLYR